FRPVDVHVPRAAYWNRAPSPPTVAQPASDPSPAPRSGVMTATCRLGRPPGLVASAVMKVGKLLRRFTSVNRVEPAFLIANRMSTLRVGTNGVASSAPPPSDRSARPPQPAVRATAIAARARRTPGAHIITVD